MVSLDPEIRDYVRQSLSSGRAILEAAIELIRRLKVDIVYEIGATTVTTTPPMSFALRRGVCQDFAHIMIAGLRGLGLPAAYVSGYLRSAPACRRSTPSGQRGDARVGACGAAPGRLDWARPDQRRTGREEHVTLAVGRDYTDVAPVDGVILGSGGQRMAVSVSVTPAPA